MSKTSGMHATILLIEDNPVDQELIVESARMSRNSNAFEIVATGEEGLAYIERSLTDDAVARPSMVLLDLGLPGMDGAEVLSAIREHREPRVRRIPVVVLTSSKANRDIVKSYDLGANAYVTKPMGLEGFAELLGALDGFWFSIVQLPDGQDAVQ